jgi:hypothetical protein
MENIKNKQLVDESWMIYHSFLISFISAISCISDSLIIVESSIYIITHEKKNAKEMRAIFSQYEV